MKLTLPFPPSVNHLYATVRGRRVLSREGRAYKQVAGMKALVQGVRPLAGQVSVTLDVFRPRKAGDLDNTQKAVLDSLKGIAWHDDSQVCEIHARRYEDKANPRVEMTIVAA